MNEVTLVVWSINRHQYLKKQLLCYSDRPINLIFVDGSDEKWDLGSEGIDGKLSWEYIHRPGVSIKHRWIEGVQRVTTQFVIFGDDTDFVVLDSVFDGITSLKPNDSFTFYRCPELHVTTLKSPARKIRSKIVIPKIRLKFFKVENLNPISRGCCYLRLCQLFGHNQSGLFFYSLHSTELSREYIKLMQTIDFDSLPPQFYEFFWVAYLVLNAAEVEGSKIGRIKLDGSSPENRQSYLELPVTESHISALTEWVRSEFNFNNESTRQELSYNLFEALVKAQIRFDYKRFNARKLLFLYVCWHTKQRLHVRMTKQHPNIKFLLDT